MFSTALKALQDNAVGQIRAMKLDRSMEDRAIKGVQEAQEDGRVDQILRSATLIFEKRHKAEQATAAAPSGT